MAEVIQLPTRNDAGETPETVIGVPNNELIARLEDLLSLAKSGDIISGAFVYVYAGYGTVADGFTETEDGQAGTYHLLNSGAARLAQRLASHDD